jgi:nitrogen regulatory protein P-II 2
MSTVTLRLVTIVTERILSDRLIRDLRALGAKGYTLSKVSGEGSRGIRAAEWEGQNIKIEAVVSPEVASAVMDHLSVHYFEHYAVIVYVQPVEVVRGDKYV